MEIIYSSKLQTLWRDATKNEDDIDRIKLQQVETEPHTVINKPQIVHVVEKLNMVPYKDYSYGIEIVVPIDNMPSDALSGVVVTPLFYSEDSFTINRIIYRNGVYVTGDNYFIYSLIPVWQCLAEGNGIGQYLFRISIKTQFYKTYGQNLPLYLDLDILFDNNRKYTTQQGFKE